MSVPSLGRMIDLVLPAEGRGDVLWIAGVAAGYQLLRALAYPAVVRVVSASVPSPRLEELGFPLRATAVADAMWLGIVCVLVWALLRLTTAPKAAVLFFGLAGATSSTIAFAHQLVLDSVVLLLRAGYYRTIWGEAQSFMLAAAAGVGVVLGAWAAYLGERRPADGPAATLAPALGLGERPLPRATRLALSFVVVLGMSQLVQSIITLPLDLVASLAFARGEAVPSVLSVAQLVAVDAGAIVVPFAAVLWAVRRFGVSPSVWAAFSAGVVGAVVANVSAVVRMPGAGAPVSEIVFVALTLAVDLAIVAGTLLAAAIAARALCEPEPSATLHAEAESA
jgi:hypothetical protein